MGVTQEMHCATCATVTPFEACSDDRDIPAPQPFGPAPHDDCPEWACIRCGEAILLAPLTLEPA